MSAERTLSFPGTPEENFSRGLLQVDIPELGDPIRGKVRDSWVIPHGDAQARLMVTTDRQSAYDRIICTIPGKGQVLNLFSAYWFERTEDIIPNHVIDIPHPNVIVAREAEKTLPVEVVLRRYMARSSTTTSVYHNYADRGRRTVYGLEFPDGLGPNEEFPMGTILTPTTKAEAGLHDEEMTDMQAADVVDGQLGAGVWERTKKAAHALFERGREHYLEKGLLLVDTKYEFGLDKNGDVMLIDEVHTPESSRLWLARTYEDRMREGRAPDMFDKEILRRWLVERGFRGDGSVPRVDAEIVDKMAEAYTFPYTLVTGRDLPESSVTVYDSVNAYLRDR